MNIKYSSKEKSTTIKDAIDVDDDQKFLKYELNFKRDLSEKKKEPISEVDLENEVYRLQNVMKKLNEEYSIKRKQLEDDCCEQLRKLNEMLIKHIDYNKILNKVNIVFFPWRGKKFPKTYGWINCNQIEKRK